MSSYVEAGLLVLIVLHALFCPGGAWGIWGLSQPRAALRCALGWLVAGTLAL
jgi:hypothetical protein